MKIPQTLKIGGHIVKVLLVDTEDINNNCGEQNAARNIIKIRKDMPQTQIESTLIHEIIHHCNTSLKEDIVGSLSEQLYQVLKDNSLLK